MNSCRFNWTLDELVDMYELPLLELISTSHQIRNQSHLPEEVQICSLISVKTGGCPEDCKYCAQSSSYATPVAAQPMMSLDEVLRDAKKAVARGATRICLGAAWREVRDNRQFDAILEMVKGIAALGVEVCCTLGMLKPHQAQRLKDAGLYAYNHNLDTSETYYKTIITTRTYQDRLQTLDIVQNCGISVCCGCILGLGEKLQDRLEFLLTLCRRNPHPESVPINQLTPVPGTPFENNSRIVFWEMLRIIAVARIVMPKALIRLSCGRDRLSYEQQALCLFAGANSLFLGEKLLTVSNPSVDLDERMFALFGIKKRPPYARKSHDTRA